MGTVSRIQRFCLHDGDGVRTVVFMQGCPLRCEWCSNPETQPEKPVLLHMPGLCASCGKCAAACPKGCIRMFGQKPFVDRAGCDDCGLCALRCPSNALSISGKEMPAREVFKILLRDRDYYEASGGGVTFSGGEAAAQPGFFEETAGLLREAGINVALETTGFCGEAEFSRMLNFCDAVLFDIKHLDPEKHRAGAGADNAQILRNLRTAAERVNITLRVPVIGGYNDGRESLEAIAALARGLSVTRVDLLPFHRMGASKYEALGKKYPYGEVPPLSPAASNRAAAVMRNLIKCGVYLHGSN